MNQNQSRLFLYYLILIQLIAIYCIGQGSEPNSVTVCFTPLNNNTGSQAYEAFAEGFPDLLTAMLSNQPNIRIVERKKLDEILKEQRLSLIDLSQSSTTLKIGKLLKADWIVIGGMTKPEKDIIINAHVYEIKTARLIISKTMECKPDKIVDEAYILANNLFNDSNMVFRHIDPNEIDENPKASTYFMKGLGYFYTSDYDRSIIQFMKIVDRDAQCSKALLWIAKAYIQNGEYEHAKIELNKLMDKFPKSQEFYMAEKIQKELFQK